eukprot:scaffold32349_cov56-Phaeocystis_antarctica.AAC.3
MTCCASSTIRSASGSSEARREGPNASSISRLASDGARCHGGSISEQEPPSLVMGVALNMLPSARRRVVDTTPHAVRPSAA